MPDDGTIRIKLTADTRQFIAELNKAAGATEKVSKSTDKVTDAQKRSKFEWGKMAVAAAAAGAVVAVGLKEAINAAGDLNESLSKMRVIFGKSAGDIEAFAETSAKSLGMSKKAAYDAAATFATFGKAAGLSGGELAKFSTDLVSLSGDLASFYNTSPEDAMDAIGAALRGESEPIRRYGVLLDDATLKAKAFEKGLITSTKQALTPQTKALAAQAEILDQTADAQGDFARTSDGLANSQRKFSAAMDDAKASLGESLLPMMTKGVKGAEALIGAFNELPGPAKDAVAVIAAGFAALAIGGPAVGGAMKGIEAIKGAIKGMQATAAGSKIAGALSSAAAPGAAMLGGIGAAASGMIVPLGLAAIAIGGVAIAAKKVSDANLADEVARLVDKMADARAEGRNLDEVLQLVKTTVQTTGDGSSYSQQFTTSSETITSIKELIDLTKESGAMATDASALFNALDQTLAGMDPAAAAAKHAELAKELKASGGEVSDLNELLPTYSTKLRDAKLAAGDAAATQDQYTLSTEELTKAIDEAKTALFNYLQLQISSSGSADALVGAEDRLAAAVKANEKANRRGADSLDRRTEAGRKNREAIRQEASAIVTYAQAVYDKAKADGKTAPEALNKSRAAIDKHRDALIKAATDAGMGEKAARRYINELLKVPKKTNTELKADATDLKDKIAAAKSKLKDPGLTKPERTKLRGDIAQLEAELAKAKRKIDGVPKTRTVTVSVAGVGSVDTAASKANTLLNTLRKLNGYKATFSVGGGGMGTGGLGGMGSGAPTGHGLMAATRGVGHPGARFMARGSAWSWGRTNGVGMHDGADISTGAGTPVYATRAGVASRSSGGWAGNHVTLQAGGGLRIIYAHLSRFGKGGMVGSGDVIGYVGWSGNVRPKGPRGAHLHIQASKNGRYVNPGNYLRSGGRVEGPGTATSDSVPAMLSDGEWVINADVARRMGDDWMEALNSGRIGGMKKGGKAKKKKPAAGTSFDAQMESYDYDISMGKLVNGMWVDYTATEQLAILARVSAKKDADQRALAEKRRQLEKQIASEQMAAAESIADAEQRATDERLAAEKQASDDRIAAEKQAAEEAAAAQRALVERRDSYASSVASGLLGGSQWEQTNGGKKWGVGSTLGNFASRASKMQSFAAMVQQLTSRGLGMAIVQQVVSAGPEAGEQMARALLAMSTEQLGQVNESQAAMTQAAAGLGGYLSQAFYGVASGEGAGTIRVDIGGSSPVVLQLDSRTIYEGQLELRRQMGGAYALVPR